MALRLVPVGEAVAGLCAGGRQEVSLGLHAGQTSGDAEQAFDIYVSGSRRGPS